MYTFLAHSVPIYFGNKFVAEEFNPKAFINVHDYKNLDEVVARIKEIDENDDLWAEMVSAAWQTDEQKAQTLREIEEYKNFGANIFSQSLEDARRRPEGYHTENYRKWFYERNFAFGGNRNIFVRAFNKFKRILTKDKFKKTEFDEFFYELKD